MSQFYVPGVGFRSDTGIRMPSRTVVEQGDRALAVIDLTSTETGTELRFEVRDDALQAACLDGSFDHRELARMDVRIRDEGGREFTRSDHPNGTGLGQHAFGFFSRHVGFEPIPRDVRRLVMEAHGALGDWEVHIAVEPVSATAVAPKHELDAAATVADVTLRVTGIALLPTETVVEFALESADRAPRACGADMQRSGSDLLVLTDEQGRRYAEELSRETVARLDRSGGRMYAKFPALPDDATQLTLTASAVVVDDEAAVADVALPIDAPTDVTFGRYRVRIGPTTFASDLLAPPGRPADYGLRFTMSGLDDDERLLRARRVVIDGNKLFLGFGWHPDPGVTSVSVGLPSGSRPAAMQLQEAVVRVRGPWDVRFDRPG